jgi:DNA-binding response OmpR family regulator
LTLSENPKVLIVDDEPDILLMMRVNLESEGFSTVLAADGETALRRVEEEMPDIILLDVMMPVLDGWGVLEALGERPARPATIVVSAKAAPGDLARAYKLGAADYVTKPFSVENLVATIRDVLGRTAEQQQQRSQQALSELGADI